MVNGVLFLFGAIVGSFLNVCIYRMPREKSIVTPGSRCTHCQRAIRWHDNIPLISFILLGGKCRHCKKKISWRYPLVELIGALTPVWVFSQEGFRWETVIFTILIWGLIVVTFVDFEHQIIPDEISVGGLAAGILVSGVYPQLHGAQGWVFGIKEAIIGAAVGAASIYLVGLLGRLIFRREAMGMGDVKLMGMLGAVLGWKQILLVFFIAPLFGSVVGLAIKWIKKSDVIPYGPFLSLATFVVLFWGERILKSLIP